MNSIRSVVQANLPSNYMAYAMEGILALEEREDDLFDAIVEAAESQGIASEDAQGILINLGMHHRPEPEVATLESLAAQVAVLTDIAKRHHLL